ncbi:tetratricopeptide repeat protein [Actinosynnema sp. NPDC051121]|nr:tetratricopeptide repeat protein [Saccharothrix sp.]
MDVEGLGKIVAARRRALVMTQQELADRAGLSVGAVRDVEQGRTRSPRPAAIRRLGAALGLSAEDLVPHASSPLRLRVLGPLEVSVRSRPVDLGPPKQREVLAVLALSPGTPVHRDAILDAVWGGSSSEASVGLLQTYVSQLRRVLRVGRPARRRELLVSEGKRYRLAVSDDEEHDLLEFRALVRQAAGAGGREAELELLERALGLFRGEPLAELESLQSLPEIAGIRSERVAAVLALADAGLDLGRPDVVLPRLRVAAEAEPLHSGVQARLMLTLAANGQTAAALKVFETARRALGEELGVAPDHVLLAARHRVLRRQLPAAPDAPAAVVPAQLPPDTADFTGRRAETARLAGILSQPRAATVVCAITGAGGMGKTALAVHVGHRVRHLFPDGQLHLDLRGAGRDAVPAGEALAEMLRALGMPESSLPNTERERAAMFRSVLADRKVLVVLDDARDPAHVRPLLPGSAGSAVLVTSRHNMAVLPGVHGCGLDPLPEAESVALLSRVADLAATPETRAHARRCGGLPLALRVTGARAKVRKSWSTGENGLGSFELDDLSVAATFALSVDLLDDHASTLFRALGLLEGPDVSVPVAARLLDVAEADAAAALAGLAQVHLVRQGAHDRHSMHDLVHAYAAELAAAEPAAFRSQALDRVLRWYLVSARRASALVKPLIEFWPSDTGDEPGMPLTSRHHAMAWLEAERANLMSLMRQALSDPALDDLGVLFVQALQSGFNEWGVSEKWEENLHLAREITRRKGELAKQAFVVQCIARSVTCYDLQNGVELYSEAISLARAAGDHTSELPSLINLGVALHNAGNLTEAARFYEEALVRGRELDPRVEGYALANLAAVHRDLGRTDSAVEYAERALSIARESGDQHFQVDVMDDLACTHRARGDYATAFAAHSAALHLARELNDPIREAIVQASTGSTHLADGEADAAIQVLFQAVAVFEESGEDHEYGQALHLLGRAHLVTGDVAAARFCLQRALAVLSRLRAREVGEVQALLNDLPDRA